MTVLTPSLICTVAAVQRQCYLMCGFIQQMWVNCAFSHFALCLTTKTALLLPLGQEVEVGPESRDTDMYSSAQQV